MLKNKKVLKNKINKAGHMSLMLCVLLNGVGRILINASSHLICGLVGYPQRRISVKLETALYGGSVSAQVYCLLHYFYKRKRW